MHLVRVYYMQCHVACKHPLCVLGSKYAVHHAYHKMLAPAWLLLAMPAQATPPPSLGSQNYV